MAITTAMCNSFKQELLQGLHDLDNHVIKLALIKASPSGTYGAGTTNYSNLGGQDPSGDEVSGTGYNVEGQVLDNITITLDGSTAIVDIDDEVFSSATMSADGCIIYNSSADDRAIAVIDFGGTKTSTNGDFTIEFPPTGGGSPDSSNAIIRIA